MGLLPNPSILQQPLTPDSMMSMSPGTAATTEHATIYSLHRQSAGMMVTPSTHPCFSPWRPLHHAITAEFKDIYCSLLAFWWPIKQISFHRMLFAPQQYNSNTTHHCARG